MQGSAPHDFRSMFFPEIRVGGYTDIDGTVVFYTRIRSLLSQCECVIDVGCGRGEHTADQTQVRRELRDLRRPNLRVLGLDIDPAGMANCLLMNSVCLLPVSRGQSTPQLLIWSSRTV